ncbi:unnamed protein product [Cuscuta epithymum]|uniref:TF-B3 domain-containing protein n=1 Tax=Cuscuta epithymum TaxID=186058 RepID=A0AAV0GHJ8_9ASTE|nr:unnamed protein product [Cuscuta epithymum]
MEAKVPKFFKVLPPGFEAKLRLPPIISRKLGEKEEQKVLLITGKGTSLVTIQKLEDGRLWFTNGWHAFVLKHGLVMGDYLTFKHMGSSNFKVTVYTETCCEKVFTDAPEAEVKAETREENASPPVKPEAEEVPPPPLPPPPPPPPPTQHHFDMIDGSNSRVGLNGRRIPGKPYFSKSQRKALLSQANAQEPSNTASVKFEEDNDKGTPFQVKTPVNMYAAKKRKRHHQFRGQGEVLKLTMKEYNLRSRSPYLHLPVDYCVAAGLAMNSRLTLRGPYGDQGVSLRVCTGGNTKYSVITRGWPEFIATNNLKVGDVCIFKRLDIGTSDAIVLDVEFGNQG